MCVCVRVCVCKTEHGLYMTLYNQYPIQDATESRCGRPASAQAARASAGLELRAQGPRGALQDFTVTAGGQVQLRLT